MITGYGTLENAITAVRLGAQDYLTKPFSLGQVEVVLAQAKARFDLERVKKQAVSSDPTETLTALLERLSAIERQLHDLTSRVAPHA